MPVHITHIASVRLVAPLSSRMAGNNNVNLVDPLSNDISSFWVSLYITGTAVRADLSVVAADGEFLISTAAHNRYVKPTFPFLGSTAQSLGLTILGKSAKSSRDCQTLRLMESNGIGAPLTLSCSIFGLFQSTRIH